MGKVRVPTPFARANPVALREKAESFARVGAAFGILVGILVLLGWAFDLPTLKGILPGLALMQPNTALSIAMAGLALYGLTSGVDGSIVRRLSAIIAVLVALIGLLTVVEYTFSADLRIDRLLFGNAPGITTSTSPGRMSLMTAICVSCLGLSLVLFESRSRQVLKVSQTLALTTTLFALLDLIGYAYGVRFLYLVSAYSSMALHTALTLFVLGVGTLASRPDRGVMRRIMADDAGGWLLRNLIPVAVVVSLLLGGGRVLGEELGVFNPRFGAAVLVLSNILAMSFLLWWNAGRLSELDAERDRAEKGMRAREEWFRTTLTSIGDAVLVTDAQGRVTLVNPIAEGLTGWTQADAQGKPLVEIFQIISESTRQPVDNPVARALRDGVIVGLANHTILIAKDGTERAIDDSAAPIRDADVIIGAVLVFRDVSERRHQQRELEGRERQFRTLAESMPQLAWMAGPNGEIDWYNQRWYEYTGKTFEQMQGWGWQSVHDPIQLPKVVERWKLSIETGQPFDMVFPLKGVDGLFRPFLTRVVPVMDDEGRVSRWFGTNTDITETKRDEEELRNARTRLESTLSVGEIGTWEYDVDKNVITADQNLARIYGIPAEAVSTESSIDFYLKIIHPDDRELVLQTFEKALESGEVYEAEYRVVTRDQGVRWVMARARVLRDDSGRGVRMPGVVMDITGKKQAEEAHRKLTEEAAGANAKFRAFFEQGVLFAGIMEVDGTLIETNRLAWEGCGYTKDQAIGKPFWEGPWWTPSPALSEQIKAATLQAASGENFRGEMPYFLADGGERMVDVIIVPIRDEAGRVVFLAPTGSDITERKLAEAERSRLENELRQLAADLSEGDHRKDEFLATLAHELRNPLAPIRNGLHIMKMAGDDRKAVDESRGLMERQVTHMVRLIDDLMDISRITRGKMELRRERVELATVVRSAVETSRPLVEEAGHELAVTLPTRPIFIDADVTRLAQVFSNLLNNAAKYTERGGDIALIGERQGSDVVVTIRDNGIGIPPEMLPKVFIMFTQVDRSLERAQGGLGIGLSLVKTLVEMHGGSVDAKSEGHGMGSEFVVRLPIVLSATPREPRQTPTRGPVNPAASLRILVVDDNTDSARTLSRLLKMLGHDVRTANDGGEAVAVAEAYRPELMLLDIGLPVLNGYDVAREIRRRPWGSDVVIIALTGWGQEGDRRRSKEAGIDNHLVKPVDPSMLERLLADLRPDAIDGTMPTL